MNGAAAFVGAWQREMMSGSQSWNASPMGEIVLDTIRSPILTSMMSYTATLTVPAFPCENRPKSGY